MSSRSDREHDRLLVALTSGSIQRTKERKRQQQHTSTATTKKRASRRSNALFRAEGTKLFCRVYSTAVDYSRQSVLTRHIKSESHKKNIAKPSKTQKTVHTSFPVPNVARLENIALVTNWIRACAA